MSGWMYTPPNSVRMIEPVGHASRQPAFSQCLQTSDENSHVTRCGALPPEPISGSRSTNFTCRHVVCPRPTVLSYDSPENTKPSSGTSFHSLHATSHALHPMHSVESVKNPVTVIAGPSLPRYTRGIPDEEVVHGVAPRVARRLRRGLLLRARSG